MKDKIEIKYSFEKYNENKHNSQEGAVYRWTCKKDNSVNIGETKQKLFKRLGNYKQGKDKKGTAGQTNKNWYERNKEDYSGLEILNLEKTIIIINGKEHNLAQCKDNNKTKFLRRFLENYFSLIEKKKLFNKH